MAPIYCVQRGLKLNERKCTFTLGLMHQSPPLTKFMFFLGGGGGLLSIHF